MDKINELASELGVGMEWFEQCLRDGIFTEHGSESFAQRKSIGVSPTPAFILIDNDGKAKMIKGSQPYRVFKDLKDEMLVT